jgi:hypothetical protein
MMKPIWVNAREAWSDQAVGASGFGQFKRGLVMIGRWKRVNANGLK